MVQVPTSVERENGKWSGSDSDGKGGYDIRGSTCRLYNINAALHQTSPSNHKHYSIIQFSGYTRRTMSVVMVSEGSLKTDITVCTSDIDGKGTTRADP